MTSKYTQKGFTIVELTLALTLLSILMIILLISTMNIISIYNKGITLKRVNQSGRAIGQDLQESLRTSKGNFTTYGSVPALPELVTRACTGKYSYIWTLHPGSAASGGAAEEVDDTLALKEVYEGVEGQEIRFARVNDPEGMYCSHPTKKPTKSESVELLGDGLVMRQPTRFTTNNAAEGRKLISAQFTISTQASGDIIRDTSRTGCKGGKMGEFCGLSTFVVTSYTYASN